MLVLVLAASLLGVRLQVALSVGARVGGLAAEEHQELDGQADGNWTVPTPQLPAGASLLVRTVNVDLLIAAALGGF